MPETKAQIIVDVAEAIGSQLEMSELLASLNGVLTPIIPFDAIAIVILEGETVTVHWAHVEGTRADAAWTSFTG
jgi:transcriptional regulator with GAF, ATPase, and Fis domain